MSSTFSRVVLLNVAGLGLGRRPASPRDFGRGARSLGHLAAYVGGLELPTFAWLGLGLATEARGLPPASPPAASWASVGPPLGDRPTPDAFAASVDGLGQHLRAHGLESVDLGACDPGPSPREGLGQRFGALLEAAKAGPRGLVRATFEPARHSPLSPHRVARGLTAIDEALGAWLDAARELGGLLVLLTSASGRDPVFTGKDAPTDESVPLLAWTPNLPSGVALGPVPSFDDLAATIADALGCPMAREGSLLAAIVG